MDKPGEQFFQVKNVCPNITLARPDSFTCLYARGAPLMRLVSSLEFKLMKGCNFGVPFSARLKGTRTYRVS